MMIWLTVVLVLVIVAVVYATPIGAGTSTSSARRVLDERLAAGELTAEEHATRATALAEGTSRRPSTALVVGIAALAILGVFWLFAGGLMGWGSGGGMMGDGDRMMGRNGGMMGDHMGRDSAWGRAQAPVAGAETVEVTATEMRFEPAVIRSAAGEPVNLSLVNAGAAFHDLVIDQLGFVLAAEPGERVTGGLTIDEPGTYVFTCRVPGHAEAGMRGTVQVSGSE